MRVGYRRMDEHIGKRLPEHSLAHRLDRVHRKQISKSGSEACGGKYQHIGGYDPQNSIVMCIAKRAAQYGSTFHMHYSTRRGKRSASAFDRMKPLKPPEARAASEGRLGA